MGAAESTLIELEKPLKADAATNAPDARSKIFKE